MDTIYPPLPQQEATTASDKYARNKRLIFWGYLLLAISSTFYAIGEYVEVERTNDNFSVFFVHYLLALGYTGLLIYDKSLGIVKSWKKQNLNYTMILLNLFLVSAYALNREIPVFENSTTWLCAYLIITSLSVLSFSRFAQLPRMVNRLQYFLMGGAIVLYAYLAIYAFNFYIMGTIGTILLGIGAHIFVPIFLLAGCVLQLIHSQTEKKISLAYAASGIGIAILFAGGFVVEWNARIDQMEKAANRSVLYANTELPTWTKIAQSLKNDWVTEKILKSELVYTVSNNYMHWDLFPPMSAFEEKRMHDPLIFLASITRRPTLSRDDRIKILQAITDSRHKTQERLWTGDNLTTSHIITDADIYPDLRIAYTEKYLHIRNNYNRNRWGTTEEALYTFQLPEGSVVTSLSLWIEGKEEKAILTSKQKADTAYTTIVGRERRDPSVVHWQEGNTVTVRVFPCTRDEERRFKIGVTSPLPVENGRMLYKSLSFRGPSAARATETVRVRILGNSSDPDFPSSFTKNEKGEFVSEDAFDDDMVISLKATPVRENQFTFNGFTYSMSEFKPQLKSKTFSTLYLDINASWYEQELAQLHSELKNCRMYAYVDDEFIQLTEDNWETLTAALHENNFSLFPFHHVKDSENSLVISKGVALSPFLKDVRKSNFAEGIGAFFASGKKVYIYNLSSSASTYVRSLKELRAFEFANGTIEELIVMLNGKHFPSPAEHEDQVVLHDARMIVSRKPAVERVAPNNAPDHLARLFAYNSIMRQVGPQFFKDDFVNEKLVEEAAMAYVVSPVSSLIVLETQQDYDRFGIKDIDNSLLNAYKNASGAVPEPHEWALILLFVLLIIFCVRSQWKNKIILSK